MIMSQHNQHPGEAAWTMELRPEGKVQLGQERPPLPARGALRLHASPAQTLAAGTDFACGLFQKGRGHIRTRECERAQGWWRGEGGKYI